MKPKGQVSCSVSHAGQSVLLPFLNFTSQCLHYLGVCCMSSWSKCDCCGESRQHVQESSADRMRSTVAEDNAYDLYSEHFYTGREDRRAAPARKQNGRNAQHGSIGHIQACQDLRRLQGRGRTGLKAAG